MVRFINEHGSPQGEDPVTEAKVAADAEERRWFRPGERWPRGARDFFVSWDAIAYAALSSAYVLLQLRSQIGVIRNDPTIYPDSVTYERLAGYSLTNHHFWHDAAWGLPLFYKLLPGSIPQSAPVAQWLLSIASWIVLATVVSTFIRDRILRFVSFALILAFSLAPLVSQWNAALLTESLSISLSALAIAGLLLVLRTPTWPRAAPAFAAVFFACATRDTNVFFLGLVVIAVAAVLLKRKRGVALALVAGVVVIFSNGLLIGSREQGSVAFNLAMRVLPSQPARTFFEQRGLPYTPSLAGIIIADRYPPGTWERDPRLADFRAWLQHSGKSAYTHYLLTHPSYSVGEPLRNLPMMIAPSRALPVGLDFFRQPGFRDALPGVSDVLYPSSGWVVIGWILIAATVGVLFAVTGMASAVWIVAAAMLVSTIPHAIVVWDADPFAIDRHSLLIGVVARLGLWFMALLILDGYFALGRTRRPNVRSGLLG